MNEIVSELKNPLTKEYLEFKRIIFETEDFPWFFSSDTTGIKSDKYFFYYHAILMRGNPPTIASQGIYGGCKLIVEQILDYNGIELNDIFRMSLNSTHYYPFKYNNPHVDHHYSHSNMLIYLNNCHGDTIVFKEKYKKDYDDNCWAPANKNKFHIKNRIKPKEDKIVSFDGSHFHCHSFPKPDERRVVFVCTYN
jgi:hypothetical protein